MISRETFWPARLGAGLDGGSLGLVATRTLTLSNLPAQVSSFIGRDGVLAEVSGLVAGARLVTLTGAGGAGKTRLALRVAAGLLDGTGDGVWFADLGPLANPDLVAETVADVLGVRLERGHPALETLADALGERSLLLVLDNCEHLIGACAKLADALLRGCQNLALLATSREPLGIDGERVYRVPSMGVPADGADAGTIRDSEAIRLLADRAAAQGVTLTWDEQGAQVAARIVRRLDGIPLAIELAAARLRMMPAPDLEARLGQRFALLTGGYRSAWPRQRTLRAMVDWSWELLTGPERAVLARLSVFAGSFDLAGAEAVAAGPDTPAGEVAADLGALADKSLVQFSDAGTGPGRYRLLETIRQYAAARLDALGAEAVAAARAAHRDYYLALAEEAGPRLASAGQAAWLDRLDAELGNLRAAIAFSLTQPDPEPGLRLVASLHVFWLARGHVTEAADALGALLAPSPAQPATAARTRALAAAVDLTQRTGDYAGAERYCLEGLDVARATGDDRLVAKLLSEHGWLLLRQGQPGAALPLIESGLDLARQLREPRLIGDAVLVRGLAREYEGDIARAVSDAGEALLMHRQTGDQRLIAYGLAQIGLFELSADDLDTARRHMRESLDIFKALNERYGMLVELHNLGLAEYLGGALDAAEALFTEALDLARRMGIKVNAACALLGLALAGRGGADPCWSARLHGAADQAMADLGLDLEPVEARLAHQDRQRLRNALGDDAFDAEYAAGRGLGMAAASEARPAASGREAPRPAASEQEENVLTPRERDVLTLVAQGLTNAEIAQRLVLSDHTVHRHMTSILRKLGLPSRAAAAAWGVRAGLV